MRLCIPQEVRKMSLRLGIIKSIYRPVHVPFLKAFTDIGRVRCWNNKFNNKIMFAWSDSVLMFLEYL